MPERDLTPETTASTTSLSSTPINDFHHENTRLHDWAGEPERPQLLTNKTLPVLPPTTETTPRQPPQLPPIAPDPIRGEPQQLDNDFGQLKIQPVDDDLGVIKGKGIPPPPPKPPKPNWLYLTGRIDYFNSSNVFAATDRLQDGLIRTGVTLSAIPAIGPTTYFLGSIDGNLVRYGRFGQTPDALNYDELRFRGGILQQLSPRMYGEVGWTNQKLFTAKDGLRNVLSGNRFLNENSIRLEFSRTDPLSPQLTLGTYYQLRWSTSDREDNTRLAHTFFSALTYKLSPQWNLGLDYFVSWSHYTNVNRDDVYQQVQLRTGYTMNRNVQVNLFGGYSFGGSTDDRPVFGRAPAPGVNPNAQLQYNAWFFGVNLAVSTPLF